MSRQTLPRQNYSEESEAGVNRQINLELYASYVYLSMSYHFDDTLKGFSTYFKKASDEEREHAELFMKFQNQRGGRIVLQDIQKPEKDDWGSGLDAMKAALQLEKNVNQSLIELHTTADKNNDYQFADWLEAHFLTHQVESIKELSDHVANLVRAGPGLGEYLFDKETLGK